MPACVITSPVAIYVFFAVIRYNYDVIYDETYSVIDEKIEGLNGAFLLLENQ